ncbi:conserved hypothetical protein [Histoplasma capsulatum H143]|uniref:Uncharacterized protein n=1 Tax=Ajellomyces capsulatus (strain H143) TaxID=544712 RepID=C6HTF5_AJECH|nr:conserved hypothetical protein [Histoplasma capsulatum H143]
MRLYLLPISTGRSLLYCKRIDTRSAKELSRLDRITQKASTTWAKWEQAEQAWKKRLVAYGNRVLQRIPYEEWGLKSVPPLSTRRQTEELQTHTQVSLVYPKGIIQESKVLDLLRDLATARQRLHRRRMLWSIFIAPLMLPVALIPLGSKHLCFLLDNNLVTPRSLPALEKFYAHRLMINNSVPPEANSKANCPNEVILLEASDGRQLAQILGPHELAAEVERAVRQVKHLHQKETS